MLSVRVFKLSRVGEANLSVCSQRLIAYVRRRTPQKGLRRPFYRGPLIFTHDVRVALQHAQIGVTQIVLVDP